MDKIVSSKGNAQSYWFAAITPDGTSQRIH